MAAEAADGNTAWRLSGCDPPYHMNRSRLTTQLIRHEGLRLKPYRCPAGKLTIGVGRNLDDRGLSEDECVVLFGAALPKAEYLARLTRDGLTHGQTIVLLDNDINEALRVCQRIFGGFNTLSEARQHALLDMALNLGETRLRGFRKVIAAVDAHAFDKAAAEMLDSKWAGQVGQRAKTLAGMMKAGA